MDQKPMGYFANLVAQVAAAGRSEANVCLMGEVGTGKKQAAAAVHRASSRTKERFVLLNCCGLDTSSFKVDLFGKMGAEGTLIRRGAASLADKGTLYFHEVGELSKDSQASLVRFLESETFRPQDGLISLTTNVRVIASTSVSLEAAVDANVFRADLYHLLTSIVIHLPRLDERKDDIPILFRSILREHGLSYDHPIESGAVDLLMHHNFTGNLLELRNIVSRLISSTGNLPVTYDSMAIALRGTRAPSSEKINFENGPAVIQQEFSKVIQAVEIGRDTESNGPVANPNVLRDRIQETRLSDGYMSETPILRDLEDTDVEQDSTETHEISKDNFGLNNFISIKQAEKQYFEKLLEKFDYNKAQAAKAAGLSLRTLYRRLKDAGIEG